MPAAAWPSLWSSAAGCVLVLWLVLAVALRACSHASRCSVDVAMDRSRVMVSEVTSRELHGSHTSKTLTPVVRSVDIQPATEMDMRRSATRTVREDALSTTTTTMTTTTSTPATIVLTHQATLPCVQTAAACSGSTAKSIEKELAPVGSASGNASASGPLLQWGAAGRGLGLRSWWLLLSLALVALCAPTSHALATNGEAVAGYIVLVSIPVLDRVLPLKNLAQELLLRGYHVGFALPENCRHWVSDLDRLEFISLGEMDVKRHDGFSSQQLHSLGVFDSYTATLQYYAAFHRPMFRALMDDFEDDRPDLLIIDRYTFAGFDASHALNIPYVVNSPSLLLDMDTPPAYIPAPFSNFTMLTPSIMERCLNSFYRLRFRVAMVHVFKEINYARQDHGLPPIQSKHDLYGHELVLVNSMFGLDEPRPITPQFQMIGMLEATRPSSKRLPSQLQQWIAKDPTKPVVLISFQADTPLSPEFVTMLLNGLETINARLVWRITLQEQAAFDLKSRSQSTVMFLRDNDRETDESLVLQHAPIALLITAGDYFSVQQALSLGVPVLGVPFVAEQWETMNAVALTGAGLQLQHWKLSDEKIRNAASALLEKPQHAAAAFRVGELLKTGGGTVRAADHVVSILQFGSSHVLPARNSQPFYKTFLVDVYLVYGAILFCAAVVLRTCFAVVSTILQIAPEVHLGMALDDEGVDPQGVADVHKPQNHSQTQTQPTAQGHTHHHHHHHHVQNHHATPSKVKEL